jgi:hypothetical protein
MRKSKEFVHEGKYAAEVAVDLIEDDTGWSPYLSPSDAQILDIVRLALRRGDIVEAAKHGRVRTDADSSNVTTAERVARRAE